MNFPMYFRSKAGNSYYKITAENVLEEVQNVGNKIFFFKIEAKIYPDMLLIKDFIAGNRVDIERGDFEDVFESKKLKAQREK